MIFTSITRALMAFLAMFSDYSFQILGKALQTFSLKRSSKKTFLIPKFVIAMINISNWTMCHTIQGVIVIVISNRLCACPILKLHVLTQLLPELYSTWSNYYNY